jgi:hypothetical protein
MENNSKGILPKFLAKRPFSSYGRTPLALTLLITSRVEQAQTIATELDSDVQTFSEEVDAICDKVKVWQKEAKERAKSEALALIENQS